jgi:regulatory protein
MAEKNSVLYRESLQKMRLLCSKQEKCTNDIKLKLAELGLDDREITRTITVLTDENYINDKRYAFSFVHDKLKFNKWGRIKIHHQLRQKGIIDEYISSALAKIDNSEYMQILKDEILKKYRLMHKSNTYEIRSKLMRFGQSKGFETDLVFQIINELISDLN